MLYGLLLKSLQQTGLWPRRIHDDIQTCVYGVYRLVKFIDETVYRLGANIISDLTIHAQVSEDHSKCYPENSLTDGVTRIIQNIRSPVLDLHCKYMDKVNQEIGIFD